LSFLLPGQVEEPILDFNFHFLILSKVEIEWEIVKLKEPPINYLI